MGQVLEAELYMDTEIRPRRSLTRAGVMAIMIPVAAVNVLFAAFFLLIGGAFVPPFLGLDVIALALAFWLSFRSAAGCERVRISADKVRVTREDDHQRQLVWDTPTAFTRVEMDHPGRHASRLRLSCSGRNLVLAAGLSPAEREQLKVDLETAIRRARAARG